MPKYQKPKGTHDLYPGAAAWEDDSRRNNALEQIFRDLCALYGYGEIRTPIFEATDVFKRSIGEETDIVTKEMFSFTDRGDRSLTLRPEGTASVIRAYVENGLAAQGGIAKLYYLGPYFRAERPQKGRYQQFAQFGIEALGADDPALDAEVIHLAMAFFQRIGIANLALKINSVGSEESRSAYLAALKSFVAPYLAEFSEEGRRRFEANPLRLLDTKNPRELEILANAPKLSAYLKDEERVHFETLCGYLESAGIRSVIDPYLVRGFDYYTKTAFEIQSPDLGAQNALGGGGRYNKLVETFGGPPTPGIGFGIGVERALIALQTLGIEPPVSRSETSSVITFGDAARQASLTLLAELRAAGIPAIAEFGAKNMKAQMRAADRMHSRYALIIGDDEMAQEIVQLKDLSDGTQIPVPRAEIVAALRSRLL